MSALGFGFLFWAHVSVSVFEAHHAVEAFSAHLIGMWIAFAAGALLITVFIGKVSEALRRREQEVLQLQEQLSRHARLASVATLAAGAAHEFGTHLATIAVVAKELEWQSGTRAENAQVADDARLIRAEVERCGRILREMSAQSAEPMGELPAQVGLADLLESVRRGLSPAARERVRVTVAGDHAGAELPAGATRQVLTALVGNAMDASGAEQQVWLKAEGSADGVRFTVADSGCGMSPETLNRIAEPFFTTKASGHSLGLGTFLVRVFAERMGGKLIFESEIGSGTTVSLEVPRIRHDGI